MAARRLTPIVLGLALSACSVIGVRAGTEEPHYTVIGEVGPMTVRQYGPRVAAETWVTGDAERARSIGFQRLAGYIFGANHGKARIAMTAPVAQAASGKTIAMTAPVAQARAGESWVIRFFMPAKETLADLPIPNNAEVRLVAVPAETYAVLRFSGVPSPARVTEKTRALLAGLAGSAWHANGVPVAWFYDPPWTLPPLRRNEVAVPVTR